MTIFNSGYYLTPQYLERLLNKYRSAYRQAEPFPHVVVDQFLPPAILEQILDELEDFNALSLNESALGKPAEGNTIKQKNVAEQFQSSESSSANVPIGSTTDGLLHQLNSDAFINFLEQLTGSKGLLPNACFESSGLRAFDQNKPFRVQADLGCHHKPLDRKVTFLIYLNKHWKEEYGGHLELWNAEMTHCEKKILPIFNRCVIFSTSEFSYYGHPEPLNCPDYETRKSLALYYYGNSCGAEIVENTFHTTGVKAVSKEIMKLSPQPIEVLIKSFIKRLIPALSRI